MEIITFNIKTDTIRDMWGLSLNRWNDTNEYYINIEEMQKEGKPFHTINISKSNNAEEIYKSIVEILNADNADEIATIIYNSL